MFTTQDPFVSFNHARKNTPNPFGLESVIQDSQVWGDVMADLSTLNQHIDEEVYRSISEIRQGYSRQVGITFQGERGVGKSHVIHRIRKKLKGEDIAFFSYISYCSDPSRIDAHVRTTLCKDFARQNQDGYTQWQQLAAKVISSLCGTQAEIAYGEYIQRCDDPKQLAKYLQANVAKSDIENFLDDLAEIILEHHANLDFDFLKAVLFTLYKNPIAQGVLNWLIGLDHPSIRRAGLPEYTSEQENDRAIWMIQQVCQLSEIISNPVVICFDELDAYTPNAETGDSGIQVVAKCIHRIYSKCNNVILLCCVLPAAWTEIFNMGNGVPDRVGQRLAIAKPATAEQLLELVQLRLNWFYKKAGLHPENYPSFFPFDETEVRQVATQVSTQYIVTRDFFKKWCATKFAEAKVDSPKVESDAIIQLSIISPVSKDKKQELLDCYQELLSKVSVSLENDDDVAAILNCTIKMLPDDPTEEISITKIEKLNQSSSHDLHLIISGKDIHSQKPVRIGVRVCETKQGQTFNAVMKRLLNYKKYKLTRGCLVRATPVPLSWRKGKELQNQLEEQQHGEVVVLKKDEIRPLAALEAIYRQSEDYGFDQQELVDLVKELKLVAENHLIREILSAPD